MTLAPYLSSSRPTTIIVTDAVRDPAVYMLDINVLDQPVSSIIGSTKTEIKKDWPGPDKNNHSPTTGSRNHP